MNSLDEATEQDTIQIKSSSHYYCKHRVVEQEHYCYKVMCLSFLHYSVYYKLTQSIHLVYIILKISVPSSQKT